MKNKTILVMLATLFLVSSLSFSSAAYYVYGGYNNGQYDSYSSHTTRSQGYMNGPGLTTSTNYNKVTSSQMLPDGTYQTTTQYIKTNRKTPNYPVYNNRNNLYYSNNNYNANYYPINYQQNYPTNYNNYNTNYPMYSNYNYGNYNGYNYGDYPPWYQKYWNSNSYPMYGNYQVRHYF